MFLSKINAFCRITYIQESVLCLAHYNTVGSDTCIIPDLDILQHQKITISKHHSAGDIAGRHHDIAITDLCIVTNRDVTIEQIKITYYHIATNKAVRAKNVTLTYLQRIFIKKSHAGCIELREFNEWVFNSSYYFMSFEFELFY